MEFVRFILSFLFFYPLMISSILLNNCMVQERMFLYVYECVKVCVSGSPRFMLSFFMTEPGLHGNKWKKCVWDLLKLCIIYYGDFESPGTVFLTVIFHGSLDEICSLPTCHCNLLCSVYHFKLHKWMKACGSIVKN